MIDWNKFRRSPGTVYGTLGAVLALCTFSFICGGCGGKSADPQDQKLAAALSSAAAKNQALAAAQKLLADAKIAAANEKEEKDALLADKNAREFKDSLAAKAKKALDDAAEKKKAEDKEAEFLALRKFKEDALKEKKEREEEAKADRLAEDARLEKEAKEKAAKTIAFKLESTDPVAQLYELRYEWFKWQRAKWDKLVELHRQQRGIEAKLRAGRITYRQVKGEKKLFGNEPFPELSRPPTEGIYLEPRSSFSIHGLVWDRDFGLVDPRSFTPTLPLANIPWNSGGLFVREFTYDYPPKSEKREELVGEHTAKVKEIDDLVDQFHAKAWKVGTQWRDIQQQVVRLNSSSGSRPALGGFFRKK